MSSLTTPLTIGVLISFLIIGYFVYEAKATGSWDRPKSILSEFAAVFFAIAIGIWISSIERDIDREETRNERQEERRETAIALMQSTIIYLNSTIEQLGKDELSILDDLVVRPNIIDSFVNSHEAFQHFRPQFGDISTEYLRFQRLSRSAALECGGSSAMYIAQLQDPNSKQAVSRWIWHIDEYNIGAPKHSFKYQRELSNEEKLKRVGVLIDVNLCVVKALRSQINKTYDLYEAVCQAASKSGIDEGCDWKFISNSTEDRRQYIEKRSADKIDRFGFPEERFKSAMDKNQVLERYLGHMSELWKQKEALTGG